MFTVGRIALFRDAGLGCLGSFRAIVIVALLYFVL
jgi:hypothetical protein